MHFGEFLVAQTNLMTEQISPFLCRKEVLKLKPGKIIPGQNDEVSLCPVVSRIPGHFSAAHVESAPMVLKYRLKTLFLPSADTTPNFRFIQQCTRSSAVAEK